MRHIYDNAAFTLLETVVYCALLGILLTSLVSTAFYVLQTSESNQSQINLEEEGLFLIKKLQWEFSIATAASMSGSNMIILQTMATTTNPTDIITDGPLLKIQEGSQPATVLTSNRVQCISHSFQVISVNGLQEVMVNLSLQTTADNGKLITQNFSLTKYIWN